MSLLSPLLESGTAKSKKYSTHKSTANNSPYAASNMSIPNYHWRTTDSRSQLPNVFFIIQNPTIPFSTKIEIKRERGRNLNEEGPVEGGTATTPSTRSTPSDGRDRLTHFSSRSSFQICKDYPSSPNRTWNPAKVFSARL